MSEVTLDDVVLALNEVRNILGLDPIGVLDNLEIRHARLEAETDEQLAKALAAHPVPADPKPKPDRVVQIGLDTAQAIEEERALYREIEEVDRQTLAAELLRPPQKLVCNPEPPPVVVAVDESVCPYGDGICDPVHIRQHVEQRRERDRNRPKPSRAVLTDQWNQACFRAEQRRNERLSELLQTAMPYDLALEQATEAHPVPPLPAELAEPESDGA